MNIKALANFPSEKALRDALLDAALPHVVFDGWSDATLNAAAQSLGIAAPRARLAFPGGGVEMAAAYHRRADGLIGGMAASLGNMRYSARVAALVRARIEAVDREAVRRASGLFALPQNAALGARLIWESADAIWRALGDSSRDVNWYTKRAILSAVISSSVLFWLGDESEGQSETWAFLERRIGNVMEFEKAKAKWRETPLMKLATWPLSGVKAPASADAPLNTEFRA